MGEKPRRIKKRVSFKVISFDDFERNKSLFAFKNKDGNLIHFSTNPRAIKDEKTSS